MRESILGYMVNYGSTTDCVDEIFAGLRSSNGAMKTWLGCLNPHSYVVALQDTLFSSSLRDADWLIPDGIGVVLASRLLGGQVHERVTGSDVFSGLHSRMNAAGEMSVFFLGATTETLALICARMARDYPNIRVAGTYSPPFKSDYSLNELEEMINVINTAAPDVLWVGMTAPKQEKWIYANRSHLDVKFIGGVGAVFDFYAGRVKRSHPVFQRLGLEWLPRLVQEPKRLWRRVFVSAPIFFLHVVRERVRKSTTDRSNLQR